MGTMDLVTDRISFVSYLLDNSGTHLLLYHPILKSYPVHLDRIVVDPPTGTGSENSREQNPIRKHFISFMKNDKTLLIDFLSVFREYIYEPCFFRVLFQLSKLFMNPIRILSFFRYLL